MTTVLDLWRAVDPVGPPRLRVGGSPGAAGAGSGPHRAAAPPYLPPIVEASCSSSTPTVVAGSAIDALARRPRRVRARRPPPSGSPAFPTSRSSRRCDDAARAGRRRDGAESSPDAGQRYLEHEVDELAAFATERAPRRRRGGPRRSAALRTRRRRWPRACDAVSRSRVDGALVALNPRPAGRALATRFAAPPSRLLADRSRRAAGRWRVGRVTGSGSWSARSARPHRRGSSTTCRSRADRRGRASRPWRSRCAPCCAAGRRAARGRDGPEGSAVDRGSGAGHDARRGPRQRHASRRPRDRSACTATRSCIGCGGPRRSSASTRDGPTMRSRLLRDDADGS